MGIEFLILSIVGIIVCLTAIYWFREFVIKFTQYVDILDKLADINILLGKPEIVQGFLDIKKEIGELYKDINSLKDESSSDKKGV